MFYLTTYSTHFINGYMTSVERKYAALTQLNILFVLKNIASFGLILIKISCNAGYKAFVTPVLEHCLGTTNSLIGPS